MQKLIKITYCETGSFGPFSKGICTDLYCIALYDFQNKYSLWHIIIYLIIYIHFRPESINLPKVF